MSDLLEFLSMFIYIVSSVFILIIPLSSPIPSRRQSVVPTIVKRFRCIQQLIESPFFPSTVLSIVREGDYNCIFIGVLLHKICIHFQYFNGLQ